MGSDYIVAEVDKYDKDKTKRFESGCGLCDTSENREVVAIRRYAACHNLPSVTLKRK